MERDVRRAVFPRLTIMSRMSNEGERQRPPTRASPHGEGTWGGGGLPTTNPAQRYDLRSKWRLNPDLQLRNNV